MSSTANSYRPVPEHVKALPLGQRIRWARVEAGLSHDRLAAKLGRSNRGHLIKIEKGRVRTPRKALRDALADALDVPRELFNDGSDDDEESHLLALASIQHMTIADVLLAIAALKSNDPAAHLRGERGRVATKGE